MFTKNFAHLHKRNKVLGFLIMLPLFGLVSWGIIECSEQPGSPALHTGQRIIYQMAGSQTLEKAGFFETYPDGRPSDFVRFLQSRRGDILWPPAPPEKNGYEPSYRQSSDNRIQKPDSLTFSAHDRTTREKPEIVYLPDDANHQIIVKGFDPGQDGPAFVYEFDFPTAAGEIPLD